jgi:CDP-glucose 4,6-dehydratase
MADGAWQPNADLWRHRRVAVTGATGFLGSHLTKQLVDLGADVVVIARDDVPATPVADWGDKVAVVRGAVEDQLLVERVLGEYEVRTLFHLAAQTQVGVSNQNPVSTWASNVMGTASVLEAARRSPGIGQIVTASSDKAYGSQPVLPYDEDMPLLARNPYDVSKACSDLIATSYFHTWGLPVCITRCGNFFGPGDVNWERLVPGVIRWLLDGVRPVVRSDGSLVRDYLYVVDGALAYLRLAECLADDPSLAGEAFNFSTETPVTVLELVDLLQRAAGTDLAPDVRGTATHEIDAQHLSAAKARKMLGWSPRWTLEAALGETVEWYRAYLGKGTP